MSARRTIGNIVIFFAVLGLIINFGIIIFIVLFVGIEQFLTDPSVDPLEAVIGLPLRIIGGLIWLGIGFLIRGKEQSFQLG